MRNDVSKVVGGVAAVGLIGSAVLSIVDQIADPPLQPALTFIRCQALWGDGKYGVKYTFLVTWLGTSAAVFAAVALVFTLVGLVRRAGGSSPGALPAWEPLPWKRMGEPA